MPYQMMLVAFMSTGVSMGVLDIDCDVWTLPEKLLPLAHPPASPYPTRVLLHAPSLLPLGLFHFKCNTETTSEKLLLHTLPAHSPYPALTPPAHSQKPLELLLPAYTTHTPYPTPAPPTCSQKAPIAYPAIRITLQVSAIECDL
ncbi:hypothetical protein M422DRAFT_247908 [Sphaerobolus stellatus SS14]|nr:hypothetical protein M422DRAFT_247908 [Sphaerobolus stellatus SS14]